MPTLPATTLGAPVRATASAAITAVPLAGRRPTVITRATVVAVITRTIVVVSRPRAAIVTTAVTAPKPPTYTNDHARVDNRSAISIAVPRVIASRISRGARRRISGIAARRVSRRAIGINCTPSHQGSGSDDESCNCKFHDGH